MRASLPLRVILGLSAASSLLVACPSSPKQAPLLTANSDATSAECKHGGTVVLSGLDKNHDHKLDANEVVARNVLCKDAPVTPPVVKPDPDPDPEQDPVVRVRVTAVPEGKDCEHGGSAVSSGLDKNKNGKLDDDEIDDTQFTCDDALVSRISSSAEGDGCVGSGVLYELGRDRNHDQKLSDDEVEWSEQECSDVLAHDATIQSADELTALAHIRVIEGDLNVYDSALTQLVLPELEQLGGALHVQNNEQLVTSAFAKLTLIGRDLEITNNGALKDLGLPVLASVGGSFSIAQHPTLATFDASKLRRLNGNVKFSENAGVAELSLFLDSTVRNVQVDKNPALTKFTLWLEGASHFSGDAPMGDLWLTDNPVLQEVSMQATDAGALQISRNPALGKAFLSTPRAESLTVSDVPSLTMLGWGDSLSTEPSLELRSYLSIKAPLTSLDYVNVGGSATIDGTAMTSLSLGRIGGDTHITNNAELANMWIHDPQGSIEITNNDALTSALINPFNPWVLQGSLTVKDNARLDSLSGFQHATQITGSVTLSGNPKFVNLHLYGLNSLGSLYISDCPSLLVLPLGTLTSLGSLSVSGAAIDEKWIDFRSLQHADSLTFTQNPALTKLSFPALVDARLLHIDNNAQLATLDLPALKQADGDATTIENNALLPACQVDALFSRIAGQKSQQGNLAGATCTP